MIQEPLSWPLFQDPTELKENGGGVWKSLASKGPTTIQTLRDFYSITCCRKRLKEVIKVQITIMIDNVNNGVWFGSRQQLGIWIPLHQIPRVTLHNNQGWQCLQWCSIHQAWSRDFSELPVFTHSLFIQPTILEHWCVPTVVLNDGERALKKTENILFFIIFLFWLKRHKQI